MDLKSLKAGTLLEYTDPKGVKLKARLAGFRGNRVLIDVEKSLILVDAKDLAVVE